MLMDSSLIIATMSYLSCFQNHVLLNNHILSCFQNHVLDIFFTKKEDISLGQLLVNLISVVHLVRRKYKIIGK